LPTTGARPFGRVRVVVGNQLPSPQRLFAGDGGRDDGELIAISGYPLSNPVLAPHPDTASENASSCGGGME